MPIKSTLASFVFLLSLCAQAQWTTYTTSNSGIPDNLIFDLAVDSSNTIWMATGFGVASFDGINWSIYDVNNSPIDPNSNNDFTAVMVDNNEHIWIAADGGYLYEFDQAGTWTPRGVGFFGDINKLAQDQDGNIWVAHQFGLQAFDGTTWIDHSGQLPTLNATTVEIDSDNEVWIGTNQGLVRYDNSSQWTIYTTTPVGDLSSTWVEDVEQGIGNDIWIGTRDGIYVFDQVSNWAIYNDANSGLFDDRINSIAVDSDSIVWVANDAGDMGVFENNVWTQTNIPFNVSFARDIIIDNDGYKWMGCSNALLKLNAQGGGTISLTLPQEQALTAFRCYPNPNNGDFTIRGIEGAVVLKLFNPLGQLVWSESANTNSSISLASNHAKGLFSLQIIEASGHISTQNILIQ